MAKRDQTKGLALTGSKVCTLIHQGKHQDILLKGNNNPGQMALKIQVDRASFSFVKGEYFIYIESLSIFLPGKTEKCLNSK